MDFAAEPGIRVCCDDPSLPQDLHNLAGKAAKAYADAAGIVPSWNIFIEKHVPSAAGLGGGSADAGTVLRLLEEHYRALGREKLNAAAAGIGADVPFFLAPQVVLAEGIGEKLTVCPAPEHLPFLLLVKPGFPVSAKWAYAHLDSGRIAPAPEDGIAELLRSVKEMDWDALAKVMHNDLEYALFEKFPLLEIIRSCLLESGALRVMVSGSGSTIFGVFADGSCRDKAQERVRQLLASDPGTEIFAIGGVNE